MTTDEVFTSIQQQNEIIISLLARLVWTPETITAIVTDGKRNPDAYRTVYNALDGEKTGIQLAAWLEEGIVLNVGTDTVPKYKRLMRIPEARKKGKRDTNGTNGQ